MAGRYGGGAGAPRRDADGWADKVALMLDVRPELVSFTFALPDAAVVARLREVGVLTMATVTSSAEAQAAEAAGADALMLLPPFYGGQPWDQLVAFLTDVCGSVSIPAVYYNVPGATGVGAWAMNRNGNLRISTAIGYLAPARNRLNLTIRGGAHVHRILFEGTHAIGAEVEVDGNVQTVHADEVILAAGAHVGRDRLADEVGQVVHATGQSGDLEVDHRHVVAVEEQVVEPPVSVHQCGRRVVGGEHELHVIAVAVAEHHQLRRQQVGAVQLCTGPAGSEHRRQAVAPWATIVVKTVHEGSSH